TKEGADELLQHRKQILSSTGVNLSKWLFGKEREAMLAKVKARRAKAARKEAAVSAAEEAPSVPAGPPKPRSYAKVAGDAPAPRHRNHGWNNNPTRPATSPNGAAAKPTPANGGGSRRDAGLYRLGEGNRRSPGGRKAQLHSPRRRNRRAAPSVYRPISIVWWN